MNKTIALYVDGKKTSSSTSSSSSRSGNSWIQHCPPVWSRNTIFQRVLVPSGTILLLAVPWKYLVDATNHYSSEVQSKNAQLQIYSMKENCWPWNKKKEMSRLLPNRCGQWYWIINMDCFCDDWSHCWCQYSQCIEEKANGLVCKWWNQALVNGPSRLE